MKLVRRSTAVVAALVVGALASGCSPESCALNPTLGNAPASCTLAPDREVTVAVTWCDCNAPVRCDVTFDGDTFFIEPRVDSCDASCPDNPESCGFVPASCTFRTPALSSNNTYSVTIADGLNDTQPATFTIAGSDTSCP